MSRLSPFFVLISGKGLENFRGNFLSKPDKSSRPSKANAKVYFKLKSLKQKRTERYIQKILVFLILTLSLSFQYCVLNVTFMSFHLSTFSNHYLKRELILFDVESV